LSSLIKIGILGGIFDPVHIGHLHIADSVMKQSNLAKVILIPAGDPPHKLSSPYASGFHRMNMLCMATADNPCMEIWDIELKRSGKSYTVDTLTEISKLHNDWKLHFIIGRDNLSEVLTWKNYAKIFKLSEVILVNRPGYSQEKENINLPGDVTEIEFPDLDISSTGIREYIKKDLSCRYLLPSGVENYIFENKLYYEP